MASIPLLIAYKDAKYLVRWRGTSALHVQWLEESEVASYYSSIYLARITPTLGEGVSPSPPTPEFWLTTEQRVSVPSTHPLYMFPTSIQARSNPDSSILEARAAVLVKWRGESYTDATWEWLGDPRIALQSLAEAVRPPPPALLLPEEVQAKQELDAQWSEPGSPWQHVWLTYPEGRNVLPIWLHLQHHLNMPCLIVADSEPTYWHWVELLEQYTTWNVCAYEDSKGEAGRKIIREFHWRRANIVVITMSRLRLDHSKLNLTRFQTLLLENPAKIRGNTTKLFSVLASRPRVGFMVPVPHDGEPLVGAWSALFAQGKVVTLAPQPLTPALMLERSTRDDPDTFLAWVESLIQEREKHTGISRDAYMLHSMLDRVSWVPEPLVRRAFYLYERRSKPFRLSRERTPRPGLEPAPIPEAIPAPEPEPIPEVIPEPEPTAGVPPRLRTPPPQVKRARPPPPQAPRASPSFISTPMPTFGEYLRDKFGNNPWALQSRPRTDWYAILDVPRAATGAEIRHAYHRESLKYHPDKNMGQNIPHYHLIQEAYGQLSDPERRRVYDLYFGSQHL